MIEVLVGHPHPGSPPVGTRRLSRVRNAKGQSTLLAVRPQVVTKKVQGALGLIQGSQSYNHLGF